MSKQNTTRKSETDWARLDAMTDEDIDYSDIPPITDEMWAKGVWRKGLKPIPRNHQDNLPIDKDIIEFFKAQGFNYPLKINQILRAYIEAHQAK
ncbi:MAG: BrnA antitoxin family protein [Acidobacteriota bacterium]|nr:BrnA antitoxin family protein [Acidobacteriota bacterium]